MSELIKISKEFRGAMGGVWLGIETEVHAEKEQDIIDAFKEKNELLERAWMAMNPQINWISPISLVTVKDYEDVLSKDEKAEGMKEIIKLANTKQLLERQRGQVERLNNPEVTELFNNKMKNLKHEHN